MRFITELRSATDYLATSSAGALHAAGCGCFQSRPGIGRVNVAAVHSTMLHGSPAHLIGNLVTFLTVGFLLEPMIGNRLVLRHYFSGGFAGAIASMMLNAPQTLSVGASGAIMADAGGPVRLEFHAGAPRPNLMRRVAGGSLVPALIPGCGAWRRGDGRQCSSRRLPGGRIYRLFHAHRLE